MHLFIEQDPDNGLDFQVQSDLRIIVGTDANLMFERNQTRPQFPGRNFTAVRCNLQRLAPGSSVVDEIVNGQSFPGETYIFPCHYSDHITLSDGITRYIIAELGFTAWYDRPIAGTNIMTVDRHIYYDATAIQDAADDEVYYVTKDPSGHCIDYPRFVILFHELVHSSSVARLPSGKRAAVANEDYAVFHENGFRKYIGLPERSYGRQHVTRKQAQEMELVSVMYKIPSVDFLTRLFVGVDQDPSYYMGFIGGVGDPKLMELISEGEYGSLGRPIDNVWIQEFDGRWHQNSTAFNWYSVPGHPNYIGKQGAFQLKLVKKDGIGEIWELEIITRWELSLKYAIARYEGNSEVVIFSRFMSDANTALTEVWGGVRFVSQSPNVTVSVIPRAVQVTSSEHYEVTLFPNDSVEEMTKPAEHVQFGSFEHDWEALETTTFSKWTQTGIQRAGNGPHEFGHMIGLPHDYEDSNSVMFSTNEYRNPSPNELNYKYGGTNRPYASHYRIYKLWVEKIFLMKEVLGKIVNLKIELPPYP